MLFRGGNGGSKVNRRQMVALPGLAVIASQAFSQTSSSSGTTTALSHKAIAKFGRSKSAYSVPKSERKRTKYINFLSSLLTLTSAQASQANAIFASAAAAAFTLRQQMKTSRQALKTAVMGVDSASITAKATQIGEFTMRLHIIGANAHAALMQLLTADQQSTLAKFTSPVTA
jgi:Spy/CpxP family protein refolding chaperone